MRNFKIIVLCLIACFVASIGFRSSAAQIANTFYLNEPSDLQRLPSKDAKYAYWRTDFPTDYRYYMNNSALTGNDEFVVLLYNNMIYPFILTDNAGGGTAYLDSYAYFSYNDSFVDSVSNSDFVYVNRDFLLSFEEGNDINFANPLSFVNGETYYFAGFNGFDSLSSLKSYIVSGGTPTWPVTSNDPDINDRDPLLVSDMVIKNAKVNRDNLTLTFNVEYGSAYDLCGYQINYEYRQSDNENVNYLKNYTNYFSYNPISYNFDIVPDGYYFYRVTITPFGTRSADIRFCVGESKEFLFDSYGNPYDPENGSQVGTDNSVSITNFRGSSVSTVLNISTPLSGYKMIWELNKSYAKDWYADFKFSYVAGNSNKLEEYEFKDIDLNLKEYTLYYNDLPTSFLVETIKPKFVYIQLKRVTSNGYYKGKYYRFDVDKGLLDGGGFDDGTEWEPDDDPDNDDGSPIQGSDITGGTSYDDLLSIFGNIKGLISGIISACGAIPSIFSTVFSFLPPLYMRAFTAIIALSLFIGAINIIRG